VDTVVIGAAWQGYFYEPDPRYQYYFQDEHFTGRLTPDSEAARRALQALDGMIRGFVAENKRVIVILQIPTGDGLDPLNMVKRSMGTLGFEIAAPPLKKSAVRAAIARIDAQLSAIAMRDGATVIDPLDSLCGPTDCPTVDADGSPMYRDAAHLRPSYVRTNVHFLDDVISLQGSSSQLVTSSKGHDAPFTAHPSSILPPAPH
jgi:hypothetical protein